MNDTIRYHLEELAIAKNPANRFHTMPEFSGNERVVLDIGCGIGQTLAAANLSSKTVAVGADIDFDSLCYGKKNFENFSFVLASAEKLPFKTNSVDFAFSRVTLPYTSIPVSISSIERILCSRGKLWVEIHPVGMSLEYLAKVMMHCKIKETIYSTYVFINGMLFHFFGCLFRFPFGKHRMESFQTVKRMRRLLKQSGFENIAFTHGHATIVTAEINKDRKKVL